MIFDMLTGSPPFTGNNRKKVIEQIMEKKLVFPKYITSFAKDLLQRVSSFVRFDVKRIQLLQLQFNYSIHPNSS